VIPALTGWANPCAHTYSASTSAHTSSNAGACSLSSNPHRVRPRRLRPPHPRSRLDRHRRIDLKAFRWRGRSSLCSPANVGKRYESESAMAAQRAGPKPSMISYGDRSPLPRHPVDCPGRSIHMGIGSHRNALERCRTDVLASHNRAGLARTGAVMRRVINHRRKRDKLHATHCALQRAIRIRVVVARLQGR